MTPFAEKDDRYNEKKNYTGVMSSLSPALRLRLADLLEADDRFHFAEISARDVSSTWHDHDFIEFFWVTPGRGQELRVDGPRDLRVGDYAVVLGAEAHRFESGVDLTLRNVALPRSTWAGLARRYGSEKRPDHGRCGNGLFSRTNRQGQLPHDGVALLNRLSDPMIWGRRDRATLDTFLLAVHHVLSLPDQPAATPPRWLAQAMARDTLIDRGVPGLVDASGYSREYVARACRQHLNQTPTEIVNQARLRRAARLLEATDMPVLEVCEQSGFQNVGHFHQRFKAAFGVSPRRYRVRYRAVLP